MAGWLVPALKAVLPHVGTIIGAAAPVFTRRTADASTVAPALQQQQIAELQTAASRNADHIRELAEQLQSTVTALERSAALAEERLKRMTLIAGASAVLAVLAVVLAIVALTGP